MQLIGPSLLKSMIIEKIDSSLIALLGLMMPYDSTRVLGVQVGDFRGNSSKEILDGKADPNMKKSTKWVARKIDEESMRDNDVFIVINVQCWGCCQVVIGQIFNMGVSCQCHDDGQH